MAARWYCFACQAGGDAIAFVEAYAQVGFRQAVRLIEAGSPLPRGTDPHLHLRPASQGPDGRLAWEAVPGPDREPPDPGRAPPRRLYDAMAVAWRYYTLDGLASLARRYLDRRSIEVGALEARERRVLAGHTPRSRTGLVEHLRRHGFSDDEAVDAGLASRHPDGTTEDFFTHRMVLAVRDDRDRAVGLIGRDVSGGLRAKYLNTPRTGIYDKGRHLYRPSRTGGQPCANLVVVEGAIDAVAIEAVAARAHMAVTAVSPSGVALTADHRAHVAASSSGPPVLCADGDAAGRAATARWIGDMTLDGREVLALSLPGPFDPADWLAIHGADGLLAFVGAGYAGTRAGEPRPVHAGRYLANELAQRGTGLATSIAALAHAGRRLRDASARDRFLLQAACVLAEAGLGPDGWLQRQLSTGASALVSTGTSALSSPTGNGPLAQHDHGGIAI
jgi:DNA primase